MVGSKAATMTTMKTYTVGAKISNAMAAAVSGTFSALTQLDNMFSADNGAAAGDFIAGLVPVKAIVNTVTYATSGTDYKGDKLSGGQVALDIALEVPVLKVVKYTKTGKVLSRVSKAKKLLPQFSSSTIDEAVKYAMDNKIVHIFHKSAHNLDPLVKKLGGHENTLRAVLNSANGKLPSSGIFEDILIM